MARFVSGPNLTAVSIQVAPHDRRHHDPPSPQLGLFPPAGVHAVPRRLVASAGVSHDLESDEETVLLGYHIQHCVQQSEVVRGTRQGMRRGGGGGSRDGDQIEQVVDADVLDAAVRDGSNEGVILPRGLRGMVWVRGHTQGRVESQANSCHVSYKL